MYLMNSKLLFFIIILFTLYNNLYIDAFHNSNLSKRTLLNTLRMADGQPKPFLRTSEGKAVVFNRAKSLIENTSLIMAFPIQGVEKEKVDLLKKKLPEGSKASVVKNAIFRQAINGTQFEAFMPCLKGQNLYIFVPEGKQKVALDVYGKWREDVERVDPNFDCKGVIIENTLFQGKDIETVKELPTRKELMIRIIQMIKNIPMRLTSTIKSVPHKLLYTFEKFRQLKENEEKANQPIAEVAAVPSP